MATNTNKRHPIKWVRDKAKAAYLKKDTCAICGTKEDLELHHIVSLAVLFDAWTSSNGYEITDDESVIEVRDEFISDHYKQIYEDVYTLCNKHHVKLHGIFGKSPGVASSKKQIKWIEEYTSGDDKNSFSDFY